MRYVPPFERLKGRVRFSETKDGAIRVKAAYDDMVQLIQVLLSAVDVDEAWYLQQNKDVAQGIREGKIKSARQHFLDHGYFEGRAPFQMAVDEAWYLAANPDVAEHVRLGAFASGQAHFDASGYREGRLPRAR